MVVPAFNEEFTIGPCIDALLAQSTPPDEIVVVDNNSTDATVAALAAYGNRVVVLGETRQGVQFARNRGMNAATGDVVVRIDADTRLPADHLACVRELFAHSPLDAATGPVRYYDVALPRFIAFLDAFMRTLWSAGRQERLDWIFGANMAVRRRAWQSVAPALCTDTRTHEDLDLGIHLFLGGFAVGYSRTMVATTSARRIRTPFREFREYMTMTERGYAHHFGHFRNGSFLRAWVTCRVILACYPPLRLAHNIHGRRHGDTRTAVTRKNPMFG